jgi:hypothetical protein
LADVRATGAEDGVIIDSRNPRRAFVRSRPTAREPLVRHAGGGTRLIATETVPWRSDGDIDTVRP